MAKAKLTPMDASGENPDPDTSKAVEVDFNPQTLRLNYRTQGATGTQNAKDQASAQNTRTQATGYNTGLTVELLFDSTRDGSNVRDKSGKIANMIQAQDQRTAPVVQFQWGDFLFRGTIQSMDETLDYFSEDGVPLRATVSLTMSGNKPDLRQAQPSNAGSGLGVGIGLSAGIGVSAGISAGISGGIGMSAGASVGTTPLTLMQSGDTVQGLAARAGVDWKAVASANNVDNPRLLSAGSVLNLNAGAQISGT